VVVEFYPAGMRLTSIPGSVLWKEIEFMVISCRTVLAKTYRWLYEFDHEEFHVQLKAVAIKCHSNQATLWRYWKQYTTEWVSSIPKAWSWISSFAQIPQCGF
jgi:hypothetical protein